MSPTNTPLAGYDPAHFASLAAAERQHFWFRARHRVLATVLRAIRQHVPARGRVLEIGCGTGGTLEVFARIFPHALIVGMDLFDEGLRYARRTAGVALLRGRVEAPPFRTRFHVIGLFDVLEHIERDDGALRAIVDLLEPGGHLVLTVPAGARLWSRFDVEAHHCRRYSRVSLLRRLDEAGFEVQYLTHFMTAIYPLVWLSRRAWRHGASSVETELRPPSWLNALADGALRPERWVVRAGWRLPFGTSLLAIASRR